METLPIRLNPGQDLRRALEAAVAAQGCSAGFVIAGIGSLVQARLRLAGVPNPRLIKGATEIVTLTGSIAVNGSHLHATLATPSGKVMGGHLAYGCTVRTTAEVLLALLRDWEFRREPDSLTGFDELSVRRLAGQDPA